MKNTKISRREVIKKGGLAFTALALPFSFTSFKKFNKMTDDNQYEVTIIGRSYSGLSAAMGLGWALIKTLIIDSGKPCNIQTLILIIS